MSEEQETQETNDGTWSGLRKTIIGTITTLVAGGGTWLGVMLFGGADEPAEETKTEQAAPAQAPITINVEQNQENKQKTETGGGTHVIERVVEKPASTQPAQPQPKPQEESW